MTASEARSKLAAENTTGPLTDDTYLACIEAQLPSRHRTAWRLEYLALHGAHYAGKRPCADEALRRCQAKAGAAFQVGGAAKWRAG